MKYRIDFEKDDEVYYNSVTGEQIAVTITRVNTDLDPSERYTIRVRTTRNRLYRRGEVFNTSGNWLSKTKKVKKR